MPHNNNSSSNRLVLKFWPSFDRCYTLGWHLGTIYQLFFKNTIPFYWLAPTRTNISAYLFTFPKRININKFRSCIEMSGVKRSQYETKSSKTLNVIAVDWSNINLCRSRCQIDRFLWIGRIDVSVCLCSCSCPLFIYFIHLFRFISFRLFCSSIFNSKLCDRIGTNNTSTKQNNCRKKRDPLSTICTYVVLNNEKMLWICFWRASNHSIIIIHSWFWHPIKGFLFKF